MNENNYQNSIFNNIIIFFNYIKENFIQICLLILVLIIIYVVDHITNINMSIFGLPSAIPIPGNPNIQKNKSNKNKLVKIKK